MTKTKLKIVKRAVKHTFTPDETANLNVDFRQAFAKSQIRRGRIRQRKGQLQGQDHRGRKPDGNFEQPPCTARV